MAQQWLIKVDDKEYAFDATMVTVEALHHIKQWYPKRGEEPALGRYNNFIEAFFEGDPDAALCAVWIARRAAGETEVPEPQKMDGNFTLNLWLSTPDEEEAEKPGPTEVSPSTAPPTPASTETPPNSGESTDGPSPQPSAGSSET